jgi:predicted O-methyltransferase YrrM
MSDEHIKYASQYNFSKNWFEQNSRQNWDRIIPIINPKKILEIGSFEGAASCYLIDKLGKNNFLEVHCIDTWEESDDIPKDQAELIEKRFDYNIQLAVNKTQNKTKYFKYKSKSHLILSKMVSEEVGDFDLIYVDASHYAVDVLTDAVLSFKLLKAGGILIFDDYLWAGDENIIYYPKIAIDSFTNIFSKHIKLIPAPLNQIYAVKIT